MFSKVPNQSPGTVHPQPTPFFSAKNDHLQSVKPAFFQPRLKVGQPDTPLEKEADAVADAVTQPAAMNLKVNGGHSTSLQRKCKACEHEEELSRKEIGGAEAAAPSTDMINEVISTGGQPLNNTIQRQMSQKIGYDFSNVVLHTDNKAAQSAEAVNARAYTLGNHVVFNEQEYNPHSREGQHLLAHELTHVVQQNVTAPATVQRQIAGTPGGPDPCFNLLQEIIALLDEVAHRIMDAENDPHGLFGRSTPHPDYGSWDGHRDRFNYDRGRLRTKLGEWDINDRCRGYQLTREQAQDLAEAREFAEREFPSRPLPAMRREGAPVTASPSPDTSPELRQRVERFLINIGIPAFALGGMVVLVMAALADPEPVSKLGLIIGTASAAALLIFLGGDSSSSTSGGPVASEDHATTDDSAAA
ncbi:DUF4157 domain-containing protein [Chitinophaga ginsengisegetis]|uniref:eCIS core domain-containing protein n=1 Tax=Chitinophaga ginsengisegetis TaxID=393003 RepID=UPI003429606A